MPETPDQDLQVEPMAEDNPHVPPHAAQRQGAQRKKRLWWIIGGAGLAVLLAGAALWFLVLRGDKPAPTAATKQPAQVAETPAPQSGDDTPVTYKSTKLNIELTHRKDWTLKESATGDITITSPRTSYATMDNQSTTGVFTVRLRKGVTDPMSATINKAVASADSLVIAYAAPTDQQRNYTNLSYAGTKDAFSFFIVTGNTALKAGNNFAYTLPLDASFYLIAGGYGTDKSGNLSFDLVPKDSMDSPTLEQAVDIVKSLKIF